MALWRPYAEEDALDLSMATVKMEPPSLEMTADVAPGDTTPVEYLYPYHPCGYELQPAGYLYPYPYPQDSPDHAVYQISLESAASAWSPHLVQSSTSHSPAETSSSPSAEVNDKGSLADDTEYQAFEEYCFRAMAERNGGSLVVTNPKMRRVVQTTRAVDACYKSKRERNNAAARLSRERRKEREAKLGFQVYFLKKKIADLRARLATGMCHQCNRPM